MILIMDVDGTLTDGHIYISPSGEMMKSFNVKDGYGIANILPEKGIVPVIITGRISDIVKMRCEELGIKEIYQGVNDKVKLLKSLLEKLDEVAYIGDDLNDFECMMAIKNAGGLIGCPSDAIKEIIDISDFVSEKSGGNGAVRDFIEWIIKKRNIN